MRAFHDLTGDGVTAHARFPMPRIVDHVARRAAVAEIAARLIAEVGLEGAKLREIARLANCSTSIVSHYFHDKRDLLLSAYRLRMTRTVERVEAAIAGGASLEDCLAMMLPLDVETADSWKIWLAFWGLATTDEAFRQEQRQRSREAIDLVHAAIVRSGAMPEGEEAALVAQAVLATVSGIAAQSVCDPERWAPERQRAILSLHLKRLIA